MNISPSTPMHFVGVQIISPRYTPDPWDPWQQEQQAALDPWQQEQQVALFQHQLVTG